MRRTVISDAEGPGGSYERSARDGSVYADPFERASGVSPERAARAALDQLAGWRITADEALGRELIAAGGRLLRHGHLMSHDLTVRPAWRDPPGYRLTDVDRPAADLLDAYRAAFPPGHIDHRDQPPERSLADLESDLSDREFGPCCAAAASRCRATAVSPARSCSAPYPAIHRSTGRG